MNDKMVEPIGKLAAAQYMTENYRQMFGHFDEPYSSSGLIERVIAGTVICYSFDDGSAFVALEPLLDQGAINIEIVYSTRTHSLKRYFKQLCFMASLVGADRLICHAGTVAMGRLLRRMGFVRNALTNNYVYGVG